MNKSCVAYYPTVTCLFRAIQLQKNFISM